MNTHTIAKHMGDAHTKDTRAIFGFWLYIMSDCLLFGAIFATYAVLHTSTFGGPSARDLFSLPFVLGETLVLLTSSFTYGLAMAAAHRSRKDLAIVGLFITFILGAIFVTMEVTEFAKLIAEGHGFTQSAFLSSFFTLVGTHGLHVTLGLVWMASMIGQVVRFGLSSTILRKLTMLALFWHFLDIVWIFIFTIVYLFGAL